MTSQTRPACFHCGLPVPADVRLTIRYQNAEHPACCAGCQAVAQSIIDAGLDSYYRHRTADAQQAALPPEEVLSRLKLYDLPAMQQGFVETLPENGKEAVLMLDGITCPACTWLIEQRLLRLPGVAKVELNYSTRRVRVRWQEDRVRLSDILLHIRQTGYTAEPYDAQKSEAAALKTRKQMITRLAVAGLASMQTMMFALPTYLYRDIEPQFLNILHWGAFIMVLPAMFYAAAPFYRGAWRDFKNRKSGMDTPIALALVLTFAAGIYALTQGAAQGMYFESIAMLVFFLLLGRFAEHNARRRAGDAAERLVKLLPAFCHRLPAYPESEESEEAAVAVLQPGDVLLVRAGETFPADGAVLSGESEADEAMLSGEHLPVAKQAGSRVTAGTVNLSGPLIMRAEQTGPATRLSHIVKLLDRALSEKPRLAEQAEKYASAFTFGQLVLAVPTFLVWWWLAGAGEALWVTVSLLVITCPCALSLATPAALAASTGRLAGQGILIARGHALETLAAATDVVFDKTGTLTRGRLRISETLPLAASPHADAVAKLLEAQSEHPVAQAFFRLPEHTPAPAGLSASERRSRIGHGVSARISLGGETRTWALGRPGYVAETAGAVPEALSQFAERGSVIALGNENGFQAAYLLQDEAKPDAAEAVSQLRRHGLRVHILSGDNQAAVAALASGLGIGEFRAGATPEDKLAHVQALQKQGRRVFMVGDGINDAPVLAAADVSAAVGGSADAAREGADIVLLGDGLNALSLAVRQAVRTARIIRQNLLWATAYNLIAVPLAVAGYVNPWVAALGMSASSLIVVGNALRLRK